jgi:hypothetical protein
MILGAYNCNCIPSNGVPVAHTDTVSPTINDEDLRQLIALETCPVERLALERCLIARHHSLA